MPEFQTLSDEIWNKEVKIKCLSVSFNGTFRCRYFSIYVQSWPTAFKLLNDWNSGAATHRVIDGHKLPLYQYSLIG